jgi:hypothetical protein
MLLHYSENLDFLESRARMIWRHLQIDSLGYLQANGSPKKDAAGYKDCKNIRPETS